MAGEGASMQVRKLEEVLTAEEVNTIVRKTLNRDVEWRLVGSEVKPAVEGMSGFLGDHLRILLHVAIGEVRESIPLFVKRVPFDNPTKAEMIKKSNIFKREAICYQLLGELQDSSDPQPWCTKTFIATDSTTVMPDLRPQGYSVRPQMETLDLPHLLTTVTAVAKFHAATTNYETRQTLQTKKTWTFSQQLGEILHDPHFIEGPWVQSGAKLTANILKALSKKYNALPDLETKLVQLYVQAIHSIQEFDDTLNVLIHKDLWVNNIMFRYEQGKPVNALLVDFQTLRYGPPAFDLMILLYCTTSRSYREQHEAEILHHYYSVFDKSLEEATKLKLEKLKYDEKDFLKWCEKARMFGALVAIMLFPYVLMDPVSAKQTYDDPDTYHELMMSDRTLPVLKYCQEQPVFKQRLLDVFEEFVERYGDI